MPSVEKIDLHFADGVSSSIRIFRSRQNTTRGVLVVLPAMGVKGSYYKHAAQHFASLGFHIVTTDHRGHGTSSLRPSRACNYGYYEQVELEYTAIFEKVRSIFPNSKVVILGHSLGGQMGSMFIARYPLLADGIILNASCSPYYQGWGTVLGAGVWLFTKMIIRLSKMLGYYPGHRTGFGGREARGLIQDWGQTVFTNRFIISGCSFDYDTAMSGCPHPVMGLTYAGDSSAPPAALKNMTDKFAGSNVTLHHIAPPSGTPAYNHYSWVRQPEICEKQVAGFFDSR